MRGRRKKKKHNKNGCYLSASNRISSRFCLLSSRRRSKSISSMILALWDDIMGHIRINLHNFRKEGNVSVRKRRFSRNINISTLVLLTFLHFAYISHTINHLLVLPQGLSLVHKFTFPLVKSYSKRKQLGRTTTRVNKNVFFSMYSANEDHFVALNLNIFWTRLGSHCRRNWLKYLLIFDQDQIFNSTNLISFKHSPGHLYSWCFSKWPQSSVLPHIIWFLHNWCERNITILCQDRGLSLKKKKEKRMT